MKGKLTLKWIMIGIGGSIGAVLREGIGTIITPLTGGFPLGTWIINMLGCFLLGWLVEARFIRNKLHADIHLALRTGLIGAFTTFSAFSVENIALIRQDQLVMSSLYIVLSVALGIGFTALGMWEARRTQRTLS